MQKYYLLIILVLISFKPHSQEMAKQAEIWLLSGSKCNICEIFDAVKENRHYNDKVSVNGVVFSIKTVDKDQVPTKYDSLVAEIAKGNEHWSVQLTVAVVQNSIVTYSGNIAESANWSNGVIASKYMRPPVSASLDELHDYGFNYTEFFKQELNLEHFAKRALNPLDRGDFNAKLDQWSAQSSRDNSTNTKVSILGTAKQPAANGLFISTRIKALQSLFAVDSLITTYANGKEHARDTLVKKGNKYSFVMSNVKADYSSDLTGMNDWIQNIAESKHNKQLVVQVGHSGPTGAPIWGSALTVSPSILKIAFEKTRKHITFVSGTCHSGLFAMVAKCGFYAAHPDAISTGCQTSLEAIEGSDDYLKFFFLQGDTGMDVNRDDKVSFHEAHWYASSKLENHNISYSDFDKHVDDYFEQHVDNLVETISLRSLKPLIEKLSEAEQFAFTAMSKGLETDTEIDLINYVRLHKQAILNLKEHTEKSSQERNALSNLLYPLNLVILARRALYVDNGQNYPLEVKQCAANSINQYY